MGKTKIRGVISGVSGSVPFKILVCIFGGFLYSLGNNVFIRPLGLYSGGVVGYSMLATSFVEKSLGHATNLYAICYVVINIPLFFLAYFGINKRFFWRTVLGVGSITLFGYIIPTLQTPVIDNILACSVIGGALTGVGTGVTLLAGGCGGGTDILGVWASKKKPDNSVGKFAFIFNLFLYVILFFVFDFQVVIYTIIVAIANSIAIDRTHYQNITLNLMIFTKKDGMDKYLFGKRRRGITEWDGKGSYTNEDTKVYVTCISKYEEHEVIDDIMEYDPQAFVIINEHVRVRGNFEKHI
ncbi:MAG: YitT family protein [Lachnospiraceae bacterium]|nr:YitT family protein [Lachnospiraceae bacterium]